MLLYPLKLPVTQRGALGCPPLASQPQDIAHQGCTRKLSTGYSQCHELLTAAHATGREHITSRCPAAGISISCIMELLFHNSVSSAPPLRLIQGMAWAAAFHAVSFVQVLGSGVYLLLTPHAQSKAWHGQQRFMLCRSCKC